MEATNFKSEILDIVEKDNWIPPTEFSVFSQHDASFYEKQREAFINKYRNLKAIAEVLKPTSITELGSFAAYGLFAYWSGFEGVESYVGYDIFPQVEDEKTGIPWDIERAANRTAKATTVKCRFEKGDLRDLSSVEGSDLMVVDAAHEYRHAYRDLLLAFRSTPRSKVILVDDAAGEVGQAVDDIVLDYSEHVEDVIQIPYVYGGCALIFLKTGDPLIM